MNLVSDIVYWIVVVLFVYTIAMIIFAILLENRNPLKSIAWVLVLVLLPFVGLVIYVLFGQDFRRRKIISKKSIKKFSRPAHSDFDFKAFFKDETLPVENQKLVSLLYNSAEAYPYTNSKVKIYTTGFETFDSLFYDIEQAQNHIHLEFYIIQDDEVGNRLRQLLIRKAEAGVRVRVIYDYLGGFDLSKSYLQSLRDAGVYIQPFLPLKKSIGFSKMNYRNHRKIVIIDGVIGYTGGLNIADRYLNGNKLGLWRDTQIRIEGSAVRGLQRVFLIDWFFVDNKIITHPEYFPTVSPRANNNLVQIVSSGPDSDWKTIMQGVVSIIAGASHYVYIHTPYLIPTESVLTAMQTAALSGVDVRVMLPEKSDTWLVTLASNSYLQQLLESGVRVFMYQHNFLHSKAIVADDRVSTIGTANMDVRSYEHNFEINAFVFDEKVATTLKRHFLKDSHSCVEIKLDVWKSRKRIDRFKESFARLFSPLI
jgi:cardiolipin synthase A/B